MVWKPHVTVAAVIEKHNKFLLVEENTPNGIAFNQPAGHLEKGEDLITAIKREVNEETAWHFKPTHIVGIQLWRKNPTFPSFLRVCFAGSVYSYNPNQILDDDIITTHWHTHKEIIANKSNLRSTLVLESIDAFLAREYYPLSLLKSFLDVENE
ncbi:MAG: NUDIX hydrolase [Methylococcales bacterium]|nr:NUDIX hydrolase [Methylococcales bacterium]